MGYPTFGFRCPYQFEDDLLKITTNRDSVEVFIDSLNRTIASSVAGVGKASRRALVSC